MYRGACEHNAPWGPGLGPQRRYGLDLIMSKLKGRCFSAEPVYRSKKKSRKRLFFTAPFLLLDMLHALADNGTHVVVGQGVKYGFSLPAALDQFVAFENAQLVGDGALGHIQRLG